MHDGLEDAVPNLNLLSILALMMVFYYGVMWVTKIVNERGDEILYGVVKGVPVSTKNRWTMLVANWFPWVVFLIAFIGVMTVGILEIAQAAEAPRVRFFGYMCVTLCAGGAVFWLALGYVLFRNMVSTLRDTTRT
jgi:hypothetical protein